MKQSCLLLYTFSLEYYHLFLVEQSVIHLVPLVHACL